MISQYFLWQQGNSQPIRSVVSTLPQKLRTQFMQQKSQVITTLSLVKTYCMNQSYASISALKQYSGLTSTLIWKNLRARRKSCSTWKKNCLFQTKQSHYKNIRCQIHTGQSQGLNNQPTKVNCQSTTTCIQLFKKKCRLICQHVGSMERRPVKNRATGRRATSPCQTLQSTTSLQANLQTRS